MLEVKYYHFHNLYVLRLFFLKEAEECCVIRILKHDITVCVTGLLEMEILVSWVHSLLIMSFLLVDCIIHKSIISVFLFLFFPLSREGNLELFCLFFLHLKFFLFIICSLHFVAYLSSFL